MDANSGNTEIRPKKILFITNAESGQANTILALALEASTRPRIEVHIASFPVLKSRVERVSSKFHFHPLDGKHMLEALAAQGLTERDLPHAPTSKNLAGYDNLGLAIVGWDGESYMRIFDSIKKLIQDLNPELLVVDTLLNPGFDACYSLNRKFVANSPNTPLDVSRSHQPWMKGLWYYPTTGSGISFPVKWKDFPSNLMASFALIWTILTSPASNGVIKYRNARGIPGRLPIETGPSRATHVICPGVREVDFPLVVPDYVGLYGPIVLDSVPLEVADPELIPWLNRGETVLMCMGTLFHYSDSQVKAILGGFLGAVSHDSNTQFLWKLPGKPDFEDLIAEALKDPRDRDRFKIVSWLEADPASIMKHPNVVAWVHHGGANSYFEGALAGLPQIILPQWTDLYDMAARAEYRGIGIYGNRSVAPGIEAIEFGAAVARLVRPGKESEGFRTRAKAAAEACRKAGGKRKAVDKLMEIIDNANE